MSLHISARTIPCMHLYVVVHTHRLQRRAKGNLPVAGSLHCSSSWQVQIQPMHVHELVPPIHVIRCAYTSTQPAIVFCSLLRLIGISSRKTLVCLYQYSLSAGGQPSASASGNIADANGWAFFLTAGLGNPHLSKRADSHQVQEEKRDFARLTGMASRATHACWRSPSSEPWVNGAHARRPAGHGCICAKMFRKDIIYMQLRCPSTARVLS